MQLFASAASHVISSNSSHSESNGLTVGNNNVTKHDNTVLSNFNNSANLSSKNLVKQNLNYAHNNIKQGEELIKRLAKEDSNLANNTAKSSSRNNSAPHDIITKFNGTEPPNLFSSNSEILQNDQSRVKREIICDRIVKANVIDADGQSEEQEEIRCRPIESNITSPDSSHETRENSKYSTASNNFIAQDINLRQTHQPIKNVDLKAQMHFCLTLIYEKKLDEAKAFITSSVTDEELRKELFKYLAVSITINKFPETFANRDLRNELSEKLLAELLAEYSDRDKAGKEVRDDMVLGLNPKGKYGHDKSANSHIENSHSTPSSPISNLSSLKPQSLAEIKAHLNSLPYKAWNLQVINSASCNKHDGFCCFFTIKYAGRHFYKAYHSNDLTHSFSFWCNDFVNDERFFQSMPIYESPNGGYYVFSDGTRINLPENDIQSLKAMFIKQQITQSSTTPHPSSIAAKNYSSFYEKITTNGKKVIDAITTDKPTYEEWLKSGNSTLSSNSATGNDNDILPLGNDTSGNVTDATKLKEFTMNFAELVGGHYNNSSVEIG